MAKLAAHLTTKTWHKVCGTIAKRSGPETGQYTSPVDYYVQELDLVGLIV